MQLVNHVFAGVRCFPVKRKLLRQIGYQIGEDTKIVGPLFCTGNLIIGDDCWIGRNLTVHGNGTVEIGNCCDLAPDVTFLTGGHQIGNSERRAGTGESYRIRVGDGVWVGARSTILGNTRIGNGSVVAACACVPKDVEPDTFVGGVPARVIRRLDNEN